VGLGDEEKQDIQAKMDSAAKRQNSKEVVESEHSSEEDDELEEDERQFQGRIRTKAGVEVGYLILSSYTLSALHTSP
jgi:hypothetical protein